MHTTHAHMNIHIYTHIYSYIHFLFPPELTSFPSLSFVISAVLLAADMGYFNSFFNTIELI